jgi:hypothetical protein
MTVKSSIPDAIIRLSAVCHSVCRLALELDLKARWVMRIWIAAVGFAWYLTWCAAQSPAPPSESEPGPIMAGAALRMQWPLSVRLERVSVQGRCQT